MSYATIEQANKILKDPTWTDLNDVEKQEKLDLATQMINMYYVDEEPYHKLVTLACIYEAFQLAEGVVDDVFDFDSQITVSESTATASASYDLKRRSNKYSLFPTMTSRIAVDFLWKVMPKGGNIGQVV